MSGGLVWRWIFAHSFALINMEEDSHVVSARWSPLSQSEDFSALLARPPGAIDLHPQSCAPQAKGDQGTRLKTTETVLHFRPNNL